MLYRPADVDTALAGNDFGQIDANKERTSQSLSRRQGGKLHAQVHHVLLVHGRVGKGDDRTSQRPIGGGESADRIARWHAGGFLLDAVGAGPKLSTFRRSKTEHP